MEEFSPNAPLSAMTWIAPYLCVTSVQYSKKKKEMKWGEKSHLYVARVVISSLISSVFIFFISSKVIKYFAST